MKNYREIKEFCEVKRISAHSMFIYNDFIIPQILSAPQSLFLPGGLANRAVPCNDYS